MPTYISSDMIALRESAQDPYLKPDSPLIGIDSILNVTNVNDGTESSGNQTSLPSHPIFLVTTENSSERWKTISADRHQILIAGNGAQVDYVGIASHSGLIGRTVKIIVVQLIGGAETEISENIVTSNQPIMFNFPVKTVQGISIQILGDEPFAIEIGNIYVGKSVYLPRNIYVGHTPLPYARKAEKLISVSGTGSFQGQMLKSVSQFTSVEMDNIPPDFYREYLYEQFHLKTELRPFFFSWRPETYPDEAGFCSGEVKMVNSKPNGFMSMSLQLEGYIDA